MSAYATASRCHGALWRQALVRRASCLLPDASGPAAAASFLSTSPAKGENAVESSAEAPRTSPPEHFAVAIVGAGPTGLTLSILLSKLGIRNVVMERAQQLTDQPQAHFINHRSMEVFRSMDGLAEEIRQLSPPLEQWRSFVYCTSITQKVFGTIDHFPGQDSPLLPMISPEPVTHLPQHRLLPLLLKRAKNYEETASVRFGCRVMGFTDHGDRVTVSLEQEPKRSGPSFQKQITCSHMVAADGANSAIREMLGIAMEGEAAMQHLINIHFFSEALASKVVNMERPAMLYFCFNPSVIAVIIAHSLEDGEFVAQVPFFPPLQDPSNCTKALAAHMIRAAAGTDIDVRIENVRPWTMSAQVASRFRKGNVFLAGDAAHRFPPAGGFGMNTGIQDAHNLAWKLSAWHSGSLPADSSLLATYETERRLVAQANTALSVQNFEDALRVPRAMGLDPTAARLVSSATSALSGWLPKGLPEVALESCLALGRMASSTSVPVLSALTAEQVQKVLREGQTLRLQYPAEDLGFRYQMPGAPPTAESSPKMRGSKRGDPYQPSTCPGSRLPHCKLQLLAPSVSYLPTHGDDFFLDRLQHITGSNKESAPSSEVNLSTAPGNGSDSSLTSHARLLQVELSTLDAVSACGGRPLLIVGEGLSAVEWLSAAVMLRREGFDTQVLQILSSDPDERPVNKTDDAVKAAGHTQQTKGFDKSAASAIDLSGNWQQLRGISGDGAVLVRPDGHVSWRWDGCPLPEDCKPDAFANADGARVEILQQLRLRLAAMHGTDRR